MGWPVAAAMIASALISAYAASQQGGGYAPAAQGTGGGNKQPFQVPSLYGQSTGGYSLLGGRPPLSQALMSGGEAPASPAYGSQTPGPFDQYQQQQQINSLAKGK